MAAATGRAVPQSRHAEHYDPPMTFIDGS